MARYMERLKTLARPPDHELAALSASPTSMTGSESIVSSPATNCTAKTAETAETSPIDGFVSFGSSFETGESDFSRRTCGTCRHALLSPDTDPVSGWRLCGLGWVGGFADHWCCDHWQDTAIESPHDAQVNRAKALIEIGWSPSNAIAKACGESTQGGRP